LAVSTADLPEGEVIATISVEGARRVPKQLITGAMTTKRGARFDAEKLEQDLLNLHALGPFEDVRFLSERSAEGIALQVEVTERAIVRNVFIAPGSSLPNAGEWNPLLQGDAYDPMEVDRVRRVLAQNLVAQGHLDAVVDVRALRQGDSIVDLCLRVTKGPAWKIERIDFPGARVVPVDELRSQVDTRRDRVNAPGQHYRAETLKYDILKMNMLHYERGLLQATIGAPVLKRLDSTGRLVIEIPVAEGRVFRVGKTTVTGDVRGAVQAYEKVLGSLSGEVFSRSHVIAAVDRLRQYQRKVTGKPGCEVVPETSLREESCLVDLAFRVEGK
jgi:outer membrane protein insertion porin family